MDKLQLELLEPGRGSSTRTNKGHLTERMEALAGGKLPHVISSQLHGSKGLLGFSPRPAARPAPAPAPEPPQLQPSQLRKAELQGELNKQQLEMAALLGHLPAAPEPPANVLPSQPEPRDPAQPSRREQLEKQCEEQAQEIARLQALIKP